MSKFNPFEVVGRGSEKQLHLGENYNEITYQEKGLTSHPSSNNYQQQGMTDNANIITLILKGQTQRKRFIPLNSKLYGETIMQFISITTATERGFDTCILFFTMVCWENIIKLCNIINSASLLPCLQATYHPLFVVHGVTVFQCFSSVSIFHNNYY